LHRVARVDESVTIAVAEEDAHGDCDRGTEVARGVCNIR
jgi:hypothetical protein